MNVDGDFGSFPAHRGPDGPSGPTVDDVEAALVKLQPRRTSVDRDRVLFLAGKAAGASERPTVPSRRRWAWPLTTLASVAAMLVFAVLFGMERRRERPVRTIVQHVPKPEGMLSQPAAGSVRGAEGAAKRQAPRVDLAADRHASDSLAAESRLLRSRHPVLMTDVDLLPNSRPDGGRGTPDPLSVGDTQRVMSHSAATRPKPESSPTSGFPAFLNHFRLGRGGL